MARFQVQKFNIDASPFQCPHCRESLIFAENSFTCSNKHCFDIASKGYVNLLPAQKPLKGYDREFFQNRRAFLDAGFYAHILEGILSHTPKEAKFIVDAGCGEGYYAKHLQDSTDATVFAFDISKDAIQIAASGGNAVLWSVADLTRIPLADHCADCLLNIFTPANYTEFHRVLKPGGTLLKVVPGAQHLKELRSALQAHIRSESYSNEDVVSYFTQNFSHIERTPLCKTIPIDQEQLNALLKMTPLAFNIDQEVLQNCHIDTITIDAELLIGQTEV